MVWRGSISVSIAPVVGTAATRREQILNRIERSALLANRDVADVRLIAVSKGRSAEEIEQLIEAGQRDFGETGYRRPRNGRR